MQPRERPGDEVVFQGDNFNCMRRSFIYRSFHFLSRQGSAQPNQAQTQWKSAMVVISEKSSDWDVLREDGYNS